MIESQREVTLRRPPKLLNPVSENDDTLDAESIQLVAQRNLFKNEEE